MKSKTIIERIIHSPIIQTLVIFVSGGWIILEIVEYFIQNFGFNENIRSILLIILLSMLPVAVFFAWYLTRKQRDHKGLSSIPKTRKKGILLSLKNQQIIIPGILIFILIGITVGFIINHKSKLHSALHTTLPLLKKELAKVNDTEGEWNWNAYHQALGLKRILRNSPDFMKLWNELTIPFSIKTDPAGAKVFAKPYSRPDTSWFFLGETPLLQFPFPKGLSRIKIEKPDFETQFDILLNPFGWDIEVESRQYQLFRNNEIPEEMVYVPGFKGDYFLTPTLSFLYVGDFWVDRFEVTNRQYKAFMDSGGYENPMYWHFPFQDGEDTLTLENAIGRFKDKTGWQGPANWELGEIPKGEDDIPVTGISWYEASAFARFLKKELPTLFHWVSLSEAHAAPEIVKFGNFDKKGPVVEGTYNSMTRYGTYDLPGNVSEWIFNSVGGDRLIIGGNFKEPTYLYNTTLQVSPWTRNDLVGFRCIKYINDTLKQQLTQKFNHENRDYANLKPAKDNIFQVYKELLEFNGSELNPISISENTTENWIREIVSLDVPYENAPMKILVFLPVNSKPPFQTIVYFPGLDAIYSNTLGDMNANPRVDFFLKSGRAVIWPVYYATYGRGEIKPINLHTWKQVHKNIMIDVQMVNDYIQTRQDLDSEKLAYFGISWGSSLAPYIIATDERFKLGILALFGIPSIEKYRYKEFDQLDFVPRVKIPMLLLGGRYDFDFTLEQQKAFYDYLGTPKENKKWMVYESTHYIPRKDLINESLNWLDKYFGPVDK